MKTSNEQRFPYPDVLIDEHGEVNILVLGHDSEGNLRVRITDPRAGQQNGAILTLSITQ